MALRRRSFFGAAAAAGSAAVFGSKTAEASSPLPAVVRTAVCVVVQLEWIDTEQDTGVVECPDGFVPVAVACDHQDVLIRLYDDQGDVMTMHAFGFRHGPIDLWRPVVGPLRLAILACDTLSVLPRPVVTIYGEIDIE